MNPRSPTVTLTLDEVARLRALMREKGAKETAKAVGLTDVRTLFKAASEWPISRLSAQVIRERLDRI